MLNTAFTKVVVISICLSCYSGPSNFFLVHDASGRRQKFLKGGGVKILSRILTLMFSLMTQLRSAQSRDSYFRK